MASRWLRAVRHGSEAVTHQLAPRERQKLPIKPVPRNARPQCRSSIGEGRCTRPSYAGSHWSNFDRSCDCF
ncbi:hypothetical protein E2C01_035784 [Portunus trituberculatus]|uniref:Uncharacterized protein n=1 Tax=Portunus trituberculatus TaxID=210409 RepID=A0A5B7F434_PORTR|nr:hypothetical protein [Portunus trituberculatus]